MGCCLLLLGFSSGTKEGCEGRVPWGYVVGYCCMDMGMKRTFDV